MLPTASSDRWPAAQGAIASGGFRVAMRSPTVPRMQDSTNSRIPWRMVIAVWMLPAIADIADTYIARQVTGHPRALW